MSRPATTNPPAPRSPDPAAKRAATFTSLGNGHTKSKSVASRDDDSQPSTPSTNSALSDSDDDDDEPSASSSSSTAAASSSSPAGVGHTRSASNLLRVPSSPNAPPRGDTGGFRFTVSRTPSEAKDTEATELQVTVRITGTEKKKDHAKDKLHVNYILKIATGLPGMNWSVARRYQAFAALHAKLLTIVPKSKLPTLPGKSVTRSFKAQYIETKRAALEAYLGQLALIADVRTSDHFCSFIVGSLEDIFDRSVSHQAIYRQGMVALKSAQDETAVAEAALEKEQKETAALRTKLTKLTADIQTVTSLQTERDDLKAQLAKLKEDDDKLKAILTPLEAKVQELLAANDALTHERNALLDSSDMLRGEIKNLKTEKKLLVKEVKSQRAQQAEQATATDAANQQYNALLARCEQLTAALAASQHTTYMAQQQAAALQTATAAMTNAAAVAAAPVMLPPQHVAVQVPTRTISGMSDDTTLPEASSMNGSRTTSSNGVTMSPVMTASPSSMPTANGVGMISIQTTPGMSPIVVPLASPSPLAGTGGGMVLPSPASPVSPVRASVSGRAPVTAATAPVTVTSDELMNVENRAPSESIAQLFADFPQRGAAASVAQFDVLGQPRGPPPTTRAAPPPPSATTTPYVATAPDPLLQQFYGNAHGQPPVPASGGMQPSYSGQFRAPPSSSGPSAATTASPQGNTAAKKIGAPTNSNASVLGMLKSKLMS